MLYVTHLSIHIRIHMVLAIELSKHNLDRSKGNDNQTALVKCLFSVYKKKYIV